MILISVLYQNASTSWILDTSPKGLISSNHYYLLGFVLRLTSAHSTTKSLCYQPIDGWWCNPNASRYTSFSINSIIKRDNGLGDEVPSKLRSYFLKCQAWYILWQRVLSNNNVLLITSKETSSWNVTFFYLIEM